MALPTNLFDENWYLARNPDVAAAIEAGLISSAAEHFNLYGKNEGRSAGPLFNQSDYLSNNPDVAAAVEAGLMTAYDHFLLYGASEGRSPLSLFDPDFYLAQNPDVAAAVEAGLISATEHFLLYGQAEPRQINPFINLGAYLDANADLADAAANGIISPLTHLLTFGAAESRDLGNGINLGVFAGDPQFEEALASGNLQAALERVEDVAPFLPTFQPPAGWEAPADTPIPVDFTPPQGTKLVIPPSVVVPEGQQLPDSFEPVVPPAPTPTPTPTPGGGGGNGGDNNEGVKVILASLGDDSGVEHVSGTDKNDTFTAASSAALRGGHITENVLLSGLNLDGKGGTDTLVATLTESNKWPDYAPTIKNVENFVLKASADNPDDKVDIGLMFSRVSGIKSLVNEASTANLTATDVREKVKIGIADMEANNPRDFAVRYGTGVDAIGTQELTLHGAHINLLTITKLLPANGDYTSASAGITTLDINASGNNSIATISEEDAMAASLAASVHTINIKGSSGTLNLNALPEAVTSINAGEYSGNLTLKLNNTQQATIIAGSGDDNITFNPSHNISVNGGGGTNTFAVVSDQTPDEATTTYAFIRDYKSGDIVDLTGVKNADLGSQSAIYSSNTWAQDESAEIHQGATIIKLFNSEGGSSPILILDETYKNKTTVELKLKTDQMPEGLKSVVANDDGVVTMLASIADGATIDASGDSYTAGVLITGGNGSQILKGSAGRDILKGGGGEDTFVFTTGSTGSAADTADYIMDFSIGDRIDLSGLENQIQNFSNNAKATVLSGNAAAVTLDGLSDDAFDAWVATVDNKDYLVWETAADGSATEVVLIGTASGNLSNWTLEEGVITAVQ